MKLGNKTTDNTINEEKRRTGSVHTKERIKNKTKEKKT